MAFTDNCDLYAAVHEDGINLVIKHVMRQRPSMFNYATAEVAANPKIACSPVEHTIDVTDHFNPLFGVLGPLPLLGVDAPPVGLNFCAQLTEAEVDFYPGNVIALPAKLNPPLPQQHLAFKVRMCGGLDCPSIQIIDSIPPTPPQGQPSEVTVVPKAPATIVPPTRKLLCFCLDAYVVAHVDLEIIFGKPTLVGKVDGVDVVGIEPENLDDAINCYLRTTFELILKEKLAIPIEKLALSFPLFGGSVSVAPTPNPPIPNNPAIEDDQIKEFVSIT
jgi:hypothetical protein